MALDLYNIYSTVQVQIVSVCYIQHYLLHVQTCHNSTSIPRVSNFEYMPVFCMELGLVCNLDAHVSVCMCVGKGHPPHHNWLLC